MFVRRTYSPAEIRPGLAVFLSPTLLAAKIAAEVGIDPFGHWMGLESHYFLVLEREGGRVAVTPLTSHPCSPGWVPVTDKRGHHGWVNTPTFFHPSQVIPVSIDALVAAAHAGGDLTYPASRNLFAGKGLQDVVERISQQGGRPGSATSFLDSDRLWRCFWNRYRTGEIWNDLRMSSVVLGPRRVRFETGRNG
jgi:hypothetical protein